MSLNPQFGFEELAPASNNPEVPVNFSDRILAQILAGEITIDFASDANRTLVYNNPVTGADEWPYSTVIMTDTGVVLTGPVDIIYPDVQTAAGGPNRHRFIFDNQTAEDLTVMRSGQTGITVAAGTRAELRHNGTDIEAIVNPIA
jgi:hypothetical protein